MHLPNNGRIVLIDDKAEEVKPLLSALGRLPVPYFYYDGSIENLPSNPPGGVRCVFLDIELHGMEGQSNKTKASGITGILKKIISDSNGPYAIIFWTLHEEIIDAVIENCSKSDIPPVASINMEKSEWLNGAGDNIDELSKALHEKLGPIGAFLLYIEWENILNDSCKQFIKDFASHVDPGEDWSKNTSHLFYALYKTFVDKNELKDETDQFRCACHLMNRSFLDTLSEKTLTELKLPQNFQLTPGPISEETKAKLNSSLFTGTMITTKPASGNVYLHSDEIVLNSLKKYLFKKDKAPEDARVCMVIVTPECDIAQNKLINCATKEEKERRLHRIIYGLYYEMFKDVKDEKRNLRDKGRDGRFDIGPLWQDKKRYLLTFHAATLTSIPEDGFSDKPLFKLKRDLLFDLQSKTANHINRLGNYQLS